jgi:hypothetical protein
VQLALTEVMHSRENRRGLVYLLDLLPSVFDHKELGSAYRALTGEAPLSTQALARMMLDTYQIGSGEKARVIRGRNLIEEIELEPEQAERLICEKSQKSPSLYRRGGRKPRRFYRQRPR